MEKTSRLKQFVGVDEICQALNMSLSTLDRLRRSGKFPPAVNFTPGRAVWALDVIEAFIEKTAAAQAAALSKIAVTDPAKIKDADVPNTIAELGARLTGKEAKAIVGLLALDPDAEGGAMLTPVDDGAMAAYLAKSRKPENGQPGQHPHGALRYATECGAIAIDGDGIPPMLGVSVDVILEAMGFPGCLVVQRDRSVTVKWPLSLPYDPRDVRAAINEGFRRVLGTIDDNATAKSTTAPVV